jgi:hypothetical protein
LVIVEVDDAVRSSFVHEADSRPLFGSTETGA